MSLLSGLWRKLRTLFSRFSQKKVKTVAVKAQQPTTADDGQGIHKDLAELAAALQQPQAKSTGKAKHKQKANKKVQAAKVAHAVVSETAPPESLQAEAEDGKASDVAEVLEAIEMPEMMEAAPVLKTAPEQVAEEKRAAAESEKPAAVEPVKPVAKPEAAQVEPVATKKEESKPVEAKKEEPKAQPVAVKQEAPKAEPPQPKKEAEKVAANAQKEVAKVAAPVATEKQKSQATANGNSDARAKAKAVTVKAPKISIPDNRLKPSSTSDPQRLARLLVSEIKLYNEKKVSEGLQNSNLYDLLKKPIDQSFDHYRTTVGDQADQSVNYFREELVKTLCDGDASKLGPNFPVA